MNNKRLLLLGITIVGSSWTYPTHPDRMMLASDTERVVAAALSPASISNSENAFFPELFLATSIGGSNGVRLNPRALNFVQDYMKENWEELQEIRANGKSSFSLIEGILAQYGLPKELKYL